MNRRENAVLPNWIRINVHRRRGTSHFRGLRQFLPEFQRKPDLQCTRSAKFWFVSGNFRQNFGHSVIKMRIFSQNSNFSQFSAPFLSVEKFVGGLLPPSPLSPRPMYMYPGILIHEWLFFITWHHFCCWISLTAYHLLMQYWCSEKSRRTLVREMR